MTIDLARRRKVMSRSMKLGHCVCNPKNPCPCETFKEYGVCPCAGEKLPVKSGDGALTRHVRKAGCASKIGQADLLRILNRLPPVTDPKLLVGSAAGDDAGVYQLEDGTCLVQTVDVFTPCVDDAYLFGQIAAANSVSDVYAMGGRPLTALSIVGFPIDDLEDRLLEEMLRGGMEKLEEASCCLVGGHSINDEEIKLGFSVTGLIEPQRVVQRSGAKAGDVLVLTKPLGTGMLSFASQIGRLSAQCMNEAGASMATLNRDAAELMAEFGATACTDITGFGLAGHLVEMIRTSRLSAEIDLERLPVFAAVPECIAQGIMSGAIERNQEYSMAWVKSGEGDPPAVLAILYDPQTSGGLLVSLPENRAEDYIAEMHRRGHTAASPIGRLVPIPSGMGEGGIRVTGNQLLNTFGTKEGITMAEEKEPERSCCDHPPAAEEACCENPPGQEGGTDSIALFAEFMKAASAPGLLDAKTKKFMAVALSISQKCEPCLKTHLRTALTMGITREEIDEAANLAISFTGCTGMMFYKTVCDQVFR